MSDFTLNSQNENMTPEERQNNVVLGFDEEGFFCLKIHPKFGKWNLFGVIEEAKMVVLTYFAEQKRAAMEKAAISQGIVRPDGVVNGFRKGRWH